MGGYAGAAPLATMDERFSERMPLRNTSRNSSNLGKFHRLGECSSGEETLAPGCVHRSVDHMGINRCIIVSISTLLEMNQRIRIDRVDAGAIWPLMAQMEASWDELGIFMAERDYKQGSIRIICCVHIAYRLTSDCSTRDAQMEES
jgi:hypothetical protein